MTTALDYHNQVKRNVPGKAFVKARRIYGNRLEDAPKPKKKSKTTTDFNEVIAWQIKRSESRKKAYNRFMAFLSIGILAVLFLLIQYVFGNPFAG